MLEKMDAFFEKRLAGYDEHMLTAIEGADEFYKYTAEHLPSEANAEVLDLGCGTGLELEEYFLLNPNARVTGIDLTHAMLEVLAAKFPDKSLNLICCSYFDAELGSEIYDAAVSVESLHHFSDESKLSLYRKLLRSLKADGYFVLTDYFAESERLEKEYFETFEKLKQEQGILDQSFYHYDTPLTVEHEIEILKKAGFSEVRSLRNWGATYTLLAKR
ncbi:MAG: methyltransferase domain-containing protein [Christensenellaceae bacterium]|nr:methyltransferase domain-containing protein [Christensenellaceae bacterium]